MRGPSHEAGQADTFGPEERRGFFSCVSRVVVKVGSGVLTRDDGLNLEVVESLCQQLAWVRQSGREVVLVSSGAVAAGMRKMGRCQRPVEMPEKQAIAAIGQASLMHEYERAFEASGIRVAQVLLTRDDLAARRRYLNARNALQTLLSWKVLPIINENDTVVVEELKFGDNDNLSAMIAQLVDAQALINLTDIDGLYTADPRTCADARIVRYVERIDAALESSASCIAGAAGTGGMASKVAAAKKACKAGIPTVVAGGGSDQVLARLFNGEEIGTFFAPNNKKLAGRKCWLGYAANPRGVFVVDKGAAKALLSNGKSLLPVGVREVRGNFGVGAPVAVQTADGKVLGVGLTNYKSSEVRRIMGRPSSEIEAILMHKGYDEVIHRNNLVITLEDREDDS